MALTLVISTSAGATDLSGQVTEVIDGRTINLKSLSHTIKVRLLAVAPPEKNQPYAEVARKHLSDLILQKFVVVRYTGIGEQGYLVGRVLLEQGDVNAQMLRDGVAWYFEPDGNDLVESDRQLYQNCEKAARSERRGLWQDASPIAPWDFKKVRAVTTNVEASPSLPQPQSPSLVRTASQSSLTSDDLMRGISGGDKATGQPSVRQLSKNAPAGSWVSYEPPDRHFAILAPSDAVEMSRPIYDENGSETNVHYVIGHRGQVLFSVNWNEGPNNKYTDATAVAAAIESLIKGVKSEIAKNGGAITISYKEVGNLRLGGYVGKDYSMAIGENLGVVRILSKQVGSKRELLVLTVMNKNLDETSANQFLNSLKVNPKP